LIGNDDQGIARGRKPAHGNCGTGNEPDILGAERRFFLAGLGIVNFLNQHAVPIEKDGWPAHRTDSHFISCARSLGWLTMPCHTTAWNASVWGVTVAALTVGTTTHASAT